MDENNKLPERKPTRLANFDYNRGGAYFLTICTQDRKRILSEVVETEKPVGDGALDIPKIRLTRYGRIVEKYILSTNNIEGVFVDKYVIMPNHIHLILCVNNDGMSRAPSPTKQNSVVSHTVSTLKRFVNKEIGENIFQRSFYDRIIRNNDEYMKICNYFALNPENWEKDELYCI